MNFVKMALSRIAHSDILEILENEKESLTNIHQSVVTQECLTIENNAETVDDVSVKINIDCKEK